MRLETILNESHEDYHKTDALTSHRVIDYCRSPLGFFKRHIAKDPLFQRSASPAMEFGSLCHTGILEPGKFNVRTDSPINPKTGRPFGSDSDKYAAWADEVRRSGAIPGVQSDVDRVKMMKLNVVAACTVAGVPLDSNGPTHGAVAEATIRGEIDGFTGLVQCRPDLWSQTADTVYDLKTTQNIDKFRWSIEDLGYGISAAWYTMLIEMLTGRAPSWRWVAVETVAPFRCRIYRMDTAVLRARVELPAIIREIQDSRESGFWPLSRDGYEFDLDRKAGDSSGAA
jgi:exodeoxyribonuclease VIII